MSIPEVVPKVSLKRKNDAKVDRSPKKGTGPSVGVNSRNPLHPYAIGLAKV